jgi:acyl-CoA reductase-like NAD-dependent aldehyde dehydrogenase
MELSPTPHVAKLTAEEILMSTTTTSKPATEEQIRTYTLMTEQEATDRVEASHQAFLEWRRLTHEDRVPYLRKIANTAACADVADVLADAATAVRFDEVVHLMQSAGRSLQHV